MKRLPNKRPQILITEDHATTRLGIEHILKTGFPRVVFGEAANSEETYALLEKQSWDLLILDISLPGQHGLDVLKEVRARHPLLPVLIYSAHAEDQFALRSLKLGARGYLTKERPPEELIRAVETILAGGMVASPQITSQVAMAVASGVTGLPHERLSDREFQVLRLLRQGKSGKTIAAELGVSEKSVATYRVRILRKLDLQTTAALIEYCITHGLS